MYIDKLDIVYEYKNTYHRIIKMKPADVKNNTFIKFGKDVNDNIVGMPYPFLLFYSSMVFTVCMGKK